MQIRGKIKQLSHLIQTANHVYAVTGAGISTDAGIPDLEHFDNSAVISSQASLEANPFAFYREFHRTFIDHIFQNGPTPAHHILSQLEKRNLLAGVITTNIDFLHEKAGNHHVVDIWRNLNVNHCLKCGRTYNLDILKQEIPHCPTCGGLISSDPFYHHLSIDEKAYQKANHWMSKADLVITIGSNAFYNNINSYATVVNINNQPNAFDNRAQLNIRAGASVVLQKLAQDLKIAKS